MLLHDTTRLPPLLVTKKCRWSFADPHGDAVPQYATKCEDLEVQLRQSKADADDRYEAIVKQLRSTEEELATAREGFTQECRAPEEKTPQKLDNDSMDAGGDTEDAFGLSPILISFVLAWRHAALTLVLYGNALRCRSSDGETRARVYECSGSLQ